MHHQASFIPSFFPEGTELGEDADFFYFPASSEQGPRHPGAGCRHALPPSPRTRQAAHAFIDFLNNPISNEIWMAQSGFLSTMQDAPTSTPTATRR